MTTFRQSEFLNEEQVERWNHYLAEVPMLKTAVEVLNKINKAGFHAYIVGGCVRDIILGHNPHDVDIATNMPMETILKHFPSVHDIGKSKDFGIVVVVYGGHQFEVAQFRTDNYMRPKTVRKILPST